MIHQSLSDFISAPLQGAIPKTSKPITQAQAQGIIDDLQTALPYLQSALQTAKDLKLANSHPDAYGDIVDVVTYCEEACDYLNEINEEDA
jgi:hypothetical protein